ncbi:FAD-binding oxidoreductase [Streptomyces violaceusniger]|uniref:NAD(P)/FAD-dependent oxidoreductase n=1 Tax=Streptomyces violaceusniger TaxID=68280 RepID=UPI0009C260F4|nr:FAD-dependent oxidoreductase [Streptomyces hygroscopicus]AQW56299.1 FAD-dependent oxidoreductase [Streptomyces hygroscopicus]
MDSSAIMGCVDRIDCLRSAIEHRLTHRKEFDGFGASGRNGGWLSAGPPGQMRRYAKAHGRESAIALQREMFSSVDEVIRVAAEEGIEADIQKDGLPHVATNAAQERRLRERLPSLRAEGWGEDDLIELDRDQLAERVRVAGAHGAQWSPRCARIQPAKLVRGLAAVVERMGVAVYEGTEVTARLVRHRPPERANRIGLGGWPRRARRDHLQPRRTHPPRPHPGPRDRPHPAALGRPYGARLGTGAAALARCAQPLRRASLPDASSAGLPPATLDELIKQAMKSAGSRASPSARAAR